MSRPSQQPLLRFRSGTKDRVARDLCLCTADGTLFSVMVGIGESYFPAFVLALGMGEVMAGWIATVPMLAGSLLQLITPLGVRWFNSYRAWVSILAAVQALSFVALIVGALRGTMQEWVLFGAVSLYWFGGIGGGPAWSTWMSLLIPARIRSRYFAGRNRWCQAGVLSGLLCGGVVLKQLGEVQHHPEHWARASEWLAVVAPSAVDLTVRGFAVLFLAAMGCRALSSVLLTVLSEPRPLPIPHRAVSSSELVSRVRHGPDGRFLLYAVSVGVAAQLAQPYFNPFLLAQLQVSETQYGVLLGAAFLGRILALPALGRMAHSGGALRVLWAGAVGIVPLSALWLVSENFWWLLVSQLLAGAAWAAQELGVFLMYFETIREDERTSVLTKFNLLNSLSMAAGTVLGGTLMEAFGGGRGAYTGLFLLSVVARGLTLLLLARVRPSRFRPVDIGSAVDEVAVRPGGGEVGGVGGGGRPVMVILPDAPGGGPSGLR